MDGSRRKKMPRTTITAANGASNTTSLWMIAMMYSVVLLSRSISSAVFITTPPITAAATTTIAAAALSLSPQLAAAAHLRGREGNDNNNDSDHYGQKELDYCQSRRCVIEYIRSQGLPEHYWRKLEERYGLRNRNGLKRLLLACKHRYAVLTKNDEYLSDLSHASSHEGPPVFRTTALAQNWRLYLIDDRPDYRNPRRDIYNVYPVTDESLRTQLLGDAFKLAFERWLHWFKVTAKPVEFLHPYDDVHSSSVPTMLELVELRSDASLLAPFDDGYYAPWCRSGRIGRNESDDDYVPEQRPSTIKLDLDIGVINDDLFSYEILAISSKHGSSIRLNSRFAWYIRLTDVWDSLLSESIESVIRDTHRRYDSSSADATSTPWSSLLGTPFRSDNWAWSPLNDRNRGEVMMHSLNAVALNELANYFGFVTNGGERSYPPTTVEETSPHDSYPSYTTFSTDFRKLLNNVSALVNSWRLVPHLTARLLSPHRRADDDNCRELSETLEDVSQWVLLMGKNARGDDGVKDDV